MLHRLTMSHGAQWFIIRFGCAVVVDFLRWLTCIKTHHLRAIYCRAGGALPALSTAAEAGQALNRSAVDSTDPSMLVLASSLVGLIFGISGTIARVVRGMGHDIVVCGTCHTEAAPCQSTKHFRAFVAALSNTHVALKNHRVSRLQLMYRATDYDKDKDVFCRGFARLDMPVARSVFFFAPRVARD